jgi:hypothetical protein
VCHREINSCLNVFIVSDGSVERSAMVLTKTTQAIKVSPMDVNG